MSRIEQLVVTRIKGFDPHQMVAATIVFEGTTAEVDYQEKVVAATAKRFGGIQGGRPMVSAATCSPTPSPTSATS